MTTHDGALPGGSLTLTWEDCQAGSHCKLLTWEDCQAAKTARGPRARARVLAHARRKTPIAGSLSVFPGQMPVDQWQPSWQPSTSWQSSQVRALAGSSRLAVFPGQRSLEAAR